MAYLAAERLGAEDLRIISAAFVVQDRIGDAPGFDGLLPGFEPAARLLLDLGVGMAVQSSDRREQLLLGGLHAAERSRRPLPSETRTLLCGFKNRITN